MNRLQSSLILSFLSLVLTSASCAKTGGPCEEPLNINESEVVVTFKNQAGDYLYKEINTIYNKDSLKVFDYYGNQLFLLSHLKQIPNTNFSYHVISFGDIYNDQTDKSSFNSELCKDFIIRYYYNRTDTVQTCFKSKETKCGSVFETLKVYHKGQLLTSVTNDAAAHITLINQ